MDGGLLFYERHLKGFATLKRITVLLENILWNLLSKFCWGKLSLYCSQRMSWLIQGGKYPCFPHHSMLVLHDVVHSCVKELALRIARVVAAAVLQAKTRTIAVKHYTDILPLLQFRMFWKLQVYCMLKVKAIIQDIKSISLREKVAWVQVTWLKIHQI